MLLWHVGNRHWYAARRGRSRWTQLGCTRSCCCMLHSVLLIDGQLRCRQIEGHVGYEATIAFRGAKLGVCNEAAVVAAATGCGMRQRQQQQAAGN